MSLNDILLKGEGSIENCYDRPTIEIAWDQWSRTRIICKHGVFEGISDYMDLEQGVQRAMQSFAASLPTGVHNACWQECPIPERWVGEGGWKAGDTAHCDLVRDHDGEHHCFPDDETEDAYWLERRVYYINGHDVTGKRTIPGGAR